MDEILGNLSNTVYHIYKNGSTYQVTFPSSGKFQVLGRDGYSYFFVVNNINDSDTRESSSKEVFIAGTYHSILPKNESGSLIFQIICGRAFYDIINKEIYEIDIHQKNMEEFLYKNIRDKLGVRKAIIDYMSKRYEELHNKPFLIYEIVTALKFNYKTILNQIDRLIREEVLDCDFLIHDLDSMSEEEMLRHEVDKGIEFPSTDSFSQTDIHAHFKRVDVEHKGNYIFLIMPFNNSEYPQYVYEEIIKPLCKDVLKCECIRVDDDRLSIDALNKIYTYTMDCKFLIADISTGNTNVLYELGMAHALQKDVIILVDKLKANNKRPFDLEHIPLTRFSNDEELRKELSLTLKSHGKRHNLIQ